MRKTLTILFIITFTLIINYSYSQITFGSNGTFSNKWHSGTLVLKNNDSLIGFIKFENSSVAKGLMGMNNMTGNNKVFFKSDINSKKKSKFKKEEINSFIIKNNRGDIFNYAYVKTSKRKVKLFRVLIDGKVSLYLRPGYQAMHLDNGNTKTTYYNEIDLYYVKKDNEEFASNRFFQNAFKSFKKTAANYFSDCSSLVSKINNGEYKSDQLSEIINEYNGCE